MRLAPAGIGAGDNALAPFRKTCNDHHGAAPMYSGPRVAAVDQLKSVPN